MLQASSARRMLDGAFDAELARSITAGSQLGVARQLVAEIEKRARGAAPSQSEAGDAPTASIALAGNDAATSRGRTAVARVLGVGATDGVAAAIAKVCSHHLAAVIASISSSDDTAGTIASVASDDMASTKASVASDDAASTIASLSSDDATSTNASVSGDGTASVNAGAASADGGTTTARGEAGSSRARVVPVAGRVTSEFGLRRDPFTGKPHFHGGVDLAAPAGSAIRAAAEGEVVFSGRSGPSGNLVTVRHPDGLVTSYAHAARTLVRAGQKVAEGDVLATVGSSGRSTGPHLHFAVEKDGQEIDPAAFLSSDPPAARSRVTAVTDPAGG
jgi:murein DD-endopeptidase MepM/ murein hydrolase activator NlpD